MTRNASPAVQSSALIAALLALAAFPPVAHSATITVDTLEDVVDADGDCALREAIEAANANAAVDGCAAGDQSPRTPTSSASPRR